MGWRAPAAADTAALLGNVGGRPRAAALVVAAAAIQTATAGAASGSKVDGIILQHLML